MLDSSFQRLSIPDNRPCPFQTIVPAVWKRLSVPITWESTRAEVERGMPCSTSMDRRLCGESSLWIQQAA